MKNDIEISVGLVQEDRDRLDRATDDAIARAGRNLELLLFTSLAFAIINLVAMRSQSSYVNGAQIEAFALYCLAVHKNFPST